MGKANELTFQNDMIRQLVANGWLLGKPVNYNRELALYEEDLIGFVKETQDESRRYKTLSPGGFSPIKLYLFFSAFKVYIYFRTLML